MTIPPQPGMPPWRNIEYQTPSLQPTNPLAIAGFIVSLIGMLGCLILGPVGMVISAFALRRKPRGFAIAGLILGILATLTIITLVASVWFFAVMASRSLAAFVPLAQTWTNMAEANVAIEKYYTDHARTLP